MPIGNISGQTEENPIVRCGMQAQYESVQVDKYIDFLLTGLELTRPGYVECRPPATQSVSRLHSYIEKQTNKPTNILRVWGLIVAKLLAALIRVIQSEEHCLLTVGDNTANQ